MDLRDPARPAVLGMVGVSGFPHRIVAHRNKLFVAASDPGLAVVESHCDATL